MKKIGEVKKDTSFLVTITTLDKNRARGQELETHIFRNNFPDNEIDGTKKVIDELLGGVR